MAALPVAGINACPIVPNAGTIMGDAFEYNETRCLDLNAYHEEREAMVNSLKNATATMSLYGHLAADAVTCRIRKGTYTSASDESSPYP